MGLNCLSTVSILRCERFYQIQTIALLIPTALELIFSTAVLFTNRSSDNRRHLWITVEGWIYFVLTLIEVVSHVVPAGRISQTALKGLDIFIGIASVMPIFCYMFFIFLFVRADFVEALPSRFRTSLKVFLLSFIPAVAALSELASFLGVCYGFDVSSSKSNYQLVVGFRTDRDRVVWTFFTSLTLALLTSYQAIAFCLAFYRFTRVFLDQKRIESTSRDEAHYFKGIAWLAAAFKLGAIETTVGFTDMGFGTALTRRLLRMLARACLCIGIARGVDEVEDFEKVREEMRSWRRTEFRRSRVQGVISNPRFSTFRQLTPSETAFHAAPRAPRVAPSFHERHTTNTQPAQFIETSEKPRVPWVAVNYNSIGAPRLDFRASSLGFPLREDELEPPPISTWSLDSSPRPAGSSPQIPSQVPSMLSITESGHEAHPSPLRNSRKFCRAESSYSVKSSDTSLSTVRELANQFPTLPHSIAPPTNKPVPPDFWDDSSITSPNSSASDHPRNSQPVTIPHPKDGNEVMESPPMPIPRPEELAIAGPTTVPSRGVSFLDIGADSEPIKPSSVRASRNPAEWIDYDAIKPLKRKSILHPIVEGIEVGQENDDVVHKQRGSRESTGSMNVYHILWIKDPSVVEEERRQARKAGKRSRAARIRSVGSAPIRPWPSIVRREYRRGSLHLQPIMIPPSQQHNTEITQESPDFVGGRSVLRDLEVLGIEDESYSRQMRENGYF